MVSFIAFLHQNADGSFTVEFPDLPGCHAVGENPGLASTLAGEELIRHISALITFGYPVPETSSELHLAADPRRGVADLMAFDVDLELLGIANPLIYHTL